ncbi:PREDICTED: oxysterol-binding protein 1-like isoform X1 [Acropora digitifera]|uniref:oxysterol-binding protein 1-like isoform X1 n=1 Tax=Acropora digitifera TaxID=70779 RepID=UPI00077A023F|nr:PREDICTED: oxysterol-binding protein 1-like isoform X1 [Acropora digitifera]
MGVICSCKSDKTCRAESILKIDRGSFEFVTHYCRVSGSPVIRVRLQVPSCHVTMANNSGDEDFTVVDIQGENVIMPDGQVCPDHFRGWLFKWTNYIKGYQKRWFVLSNGLLSYYRSQAEMAHTCRGTINLAGAFIDAEDSCSFVISNGGTQIFYMRANSEVERQRWVTALELAKAKAIKMLESDEEEDSNSDQAENIKPLNTKLDDLQTCNDLVSKHGSALQRAIVELQEVEDNPALLSKLKFVNEKATLFRITANAMISACAEFLELAQTQEKKWHKSLHFERQRRITLEETVETLAKQHNTLERACRKSTGAVLPAIPGSEPGHDSDEEEEAEEEDDENAEFFDAIAEHPEGFTLSVCKSGDSLRSSSSEISLDLETNKAMLSGTLSDNSVSGKTEGVTEATGTKTSLEEDGLTEDTNGNAQSQVVTAPFTVGGTFGASGTQPTGKIVTKQFRRQIPDKPDISINLWSIMKNCIGKELSKIPMPVNFNEPISMLQRLTEELEYAHLLDRAAACESSTEQMCYVAAFTVSSYSTTATRVGKPFNPLLGETFEFDRTEDLGWRSLAEQVSHHPPASALHVEHKDWIFWQEFSLASKFRGKYLQVIPHGTAHLKFNRTGNHYSWKKVTTTVHNIIVGKLWIDQSGEMDIENHTTKDVCHLKYDAYNYFGRDTPRKVTGVITDHHKVVRYVISGTWDNKIDGAKVVYTRTSSSAVKQPPSTPHKSQAQTMPPVALWKANPPLPGCEKMYNFTEFALALNQPDDGVAPTDSRRRPDQRLMENCMWDEANQEKQKLEELQRTRRRKREVEAAEAQKEGKVYEGYKPCWFENVLDEVTNSSLHVYRGGYWEAKETKEWSLCPEIYS